MKNTNTILFLGLLFCSTPTVCAQENATALTPIPLAGDNRGRNGSGDFVKSASWTVISPQVLNGAVFIQPSRNQGLGKRTDEYFDKAFLRLSPSAEATVGVSQPLNDAFPYGSPILAQAGDRYRIGVNMRGQDGSGQVVVELRDEDGETVVASSPVTPKEIRRYFFDLEIPEDASQNAPLHLALLGVQGENSETGSFDLDQVSVAKIIPDQDEFQPLFNGTDLTGWTGSLTGYGVEDGAIRTYPKRAGGNIYTEKEYDDFIFRFRYKVEPGSNNGIAIRAPLSGDAAYQGMEVQLLENSHPKYAGLKPWQFHGSIYGVAPALRGYQRPPGEWNDEEIRLEGRYMRVVLNGKIILNVDLDQVAEEGALSGKDHPGLANTTGHIGFCGHGDLVEFKDLRIQPLPGKKNENSTPNRR